MLPLACFTLGRGPDKTAAAAGRIWFSSPSLGVALAGEQQATCCCLGHGCASTSDESVRRVSRRGDGDDST